MLLPPRPPSAETATGGDREGDETRRHRARATRQSGALETPIVPLAAEGPPLSNSSESRPQRVGRRANARNQRENDLRLQRRTAYRVRCRRYETDVKLLHRLGFGGETSDCGTVLIADADAKERSHLSRLLVEAGYRPVVSSSGGDAIASARRERPLLAIIAVRLPDVSGYEICRALKDLHGERLPVILISGWRTEAYDRTAGLMIGADDYVVKPFDPGELLARARRCIARSSAFTAAGAYAKAADYGMTPREHEILSLLARGLDTGAIARQLVISEKTVATHIQRVLMKLGVHSRGSAIARAHAEGLVGAARNIELNRNGNAS